MKPDFRYLAFLYPNNRRTRKIKNDVDLQQDKNEVKITIVAKKCGIIEIGLI